MKKLAYILSITFTLALLVHASYADRGVGKKKAKVTFNIKTPSSFSSSLNYNLRNGLKYTGSITNTFTPSVTNTLVTYKKGSSIYIIPTKPKVIVADVKQGYTGAKLIIKIH